jgi:hypothetical protein
MTNLSREILSMVKNIACRMDDFSKAICVDEMPELRPNLKKQIAKTVNFLITSSRIQHNKFSRSSSPKLKKTFHSWSKFQVAQVYVEKY